MDLNELYHEHQVLEMRAAGTMSPVERIINHRSAAAVAGRIGRQQHDLGAAASIAWTALALVPLTDKARLPRHEGDRPAGVLGLFEQGATD